MVATTLRINDRWEGSNSRRSATSRVIPWTDRRRGPLYRRTPCRFDPSRTCGRRRRLGPADKSVPVETIDRFDELGAAQIHMEHITRVSETVPGRVPERVD